MTTLSRQYRTRIDLSNVSAGWFDQLFIPETIRGSNKYGVILLHGASTASLTAYDWLGTGWPALCKMAAALAREGIPAIAAGMDGNHYAKPIVTQNDASGYINKALAYLAAQTGCSASKAHVFGASMGGGTGVAWAARNPAKAASVSGIIPMSSLIKLYNQYSGLPVVNGFQSGIATAWAVTPAFRSVADAVLNGTAVVTSVTANFQPADVGSQVAPNAAGVFPADTKVLSRQSTTQVTMDKAALISASGQTLGLGGPLPMAGLTGADLLGVHAPLLDSNDIPTRLWYSSDDSYVQAADVVALAAAAGGQAHNVGALNHTNAAVAAMDTWNGGTDFSDWIAWLKTNGS